MNYTNFQIHKPIDATPNKLYWKSEDGTDWHVAKLIKDY